MSRSIYQNNGKPLSQQAIYQQKVKQGIYGGPATKSIGVSSNASDTAALLAASADLTVKPSYERTIAQDAHTAALAAKKENIAIWSRDNTDPQADAAAANAKTNTLVSTSSSKYTSSVGGGVPSLKGDSLYKVAQENSSSTMTTRTDPERDIKRSGLVAKSAASNFDIAKINQVANKNSSKSLNSRFNPALDYRSGLNAHQPPTEYLNQEEEDLAASGAAASLKHGAGYTNKVSAQRRSQSFKAGDVVNSTLLSAANERANERLKSMSSVTPQDFKAQAQAYASALQIAQRNSDERIKNNNAGLINLGGGLTMENSEIMKLASLVVQPVLNDINTKAGEQRDSDNSKLQKLAELDVLHKKAKQEENTKKSQERVDLENAKNERLKAHEAKKAGEDELYSSYQEERNEELKAKTVELKEEEAQNAEAKEKLLTEKQENQDRIDSEEAELIAARKSELDELQAEKDEIMKPTLDALKEETSKLEELQAARDELQNEVTASEDLNKEFEEKVKELNEKLEATNEEIEKLKTDLKDVSLRHEETSKEVENLHSTDNEESQKAKELHADLDSKIEKLNETHEEHIASKSAKKAEILALIDESVKDERKINEELPEHLRLDINESKLRDTSSLFSAEEVADAKEEPIETTAMKVTENKASKADVGTSSSPTKKKSGLKRFTKFLRSSSKDKISPAKKVSSTISAPVSAKTEEPKVKSQSDASNVEFDDDISLSKNQNQGGLFKEEI